MVRKYYRSPAGSAILSLKLLALILLLSSHLLIASSLGNNQSSTHSADGSMKVNWLFVVGTSGCTNVTVTVVNITEPNLYFQLPKTYELLSISPTVNYAITPENGSSWDWFEIRDINVTNLTFTFTWPDGAVLYKGLFYFSGQESFYSGNTKASGNITIELPKNTKRILIKEPNYAQVGNNTVVLVYSSKREIPHFKYFLTEQSFNDVFELEISEHVNLRYHSVMAGKPWIVKTLEVIEKSWSWLKTTLNGTLSHVNVTFVPHGYNRLGTTLEGFTHDGSRNIEIVATKQFGIGFDGRVTSLLFHEISHALTPLLEDLPSFYVEAIAQDLSCDALRRTNLNSSADSLEELWFESAYEGIEFEILHYTWIWNWNNTIYKNPVILSTVYGVAAFLGDYMTHLGSYLAYNRLDNIFNKTEISALDEPQRLIKFTEYLSQAFNYNMTEVLTDGYLKTLITKWKEAKDLRSWEYRLEVIGPFTWYASLKFVNLVNQANYEYNKRNYDSAISKYMDAKALMISSFWPTHDYVFWIVVVVVVGVIILIRRRSYHASTFSRGSSCWLYFV